MQCVNVYIKMRLAEGTFQFDALMPEMHLNHISVQCQFLARREHVSRFYKHYSVNAVLWYA